MTAAAGFGPSCRGGPAGRCAAPATTAPMSAPEGPAGCAGGSLPSACRPRRPAPTSASTATSFLRTCAGAAGAPGPAPGWRPACRGVFAASPEPPRSALIAERTVRPPPAGPRGRCATLATAPPSVGGARARTAAWNDGWCHPPAPAPPGAVTARDWLRYTPVWSAVGRTSSMSGAAANDAPSPAAAPKSSPAQTGWCRLCWLGCATPSPPRRLRAKR